MSVKRVLTNIGKQLDGYEEYDDKINRMIKEYEDLPGIEEWGMRGEGWGGGRGGERVGLTVSYWVGLECAIGDERGWSDAVFVGLGRLLRELRGRSGGWAAVRSGIVWVLRGVTAVERWSRLTWLRQVGLIGYRKHSRGWDGDDELWNPKRVEGVRGDGIELASSSKAGRDAVLALWEQRLDCSGLKEVWGEEFGDEWRKRRDGKQCRVQSMEIRDEGVWAAVVELGVQSAVGAESVRWMVDRLDGMKGRGVDSRIDQVHVWRTGRDWDFKERIRSRGIDPQVWWDRKEWETYGGRLVLASRTTDDKPVPA
jgi:hypothetical protein